MTMGHKEQARPAALVSVIIVNFNGAAVIAQCLRSVYDQPYRPMEVIVVDNASSDGSAAMVADAYPDVRLLINSSNLGFATGNNQGVKAAKGEYVVLLNNDTVVGRQWLMPLVDMLDRPGVAAVTSRVVTENVPAALYERNGTINYLGYNIMREFSDLSEVFFAGGASLMFRREDVGIPFLDEYFLYHEDVFLSWKLRLLGKKVAMAQESVVHHRGSVSTRRQPPRVVTFFQERNRLLNALLFYETRTLLLLLPYVLADGVAKVVLALVSGRKSLVGILRGYGWMLRHAGWIRHTRTALQNSRRVADHEVMKMMSCRVADSHSGPANALNRISRGYARIVGLAFHE